jgi:hypothetical protein
MEFVIRFAACAATLGGRWGCGDVMIKTFGRLAASDGGVISLMGADLGGVRCELLANLGGL